MPIRPLLVANTLVCSRSRLWSQILLNFVVPQAPKFPYRERKLAAVGITRMLCHSRLMVQEPSIKAWFVPCVLKPRNEILT